MRSSGAGLWPEPLLCHDLPVSKIGIILCKSKVCKIKNCDSPLGCTAWVQFVHLQGQVTYMLEYDVSCFSSTVFPSVFLTADDKFKTSFSMHPFQNKLFCKKENEEANALQRWVAPSCSTYLSKLGRRKKRSWWVWVPRLPALYCLLSAGMSCSPYSLHGPLHSWLAFLCQIIFFLPVKGYQKATKGTKEE